jgi:hypothetical protein
MECHSIVLSEPMRDTASSGVSGNPFSTRHCSRYRQIPASRSGHGSTATITTARIWALGNYAGQVHGKQKTGKSRHVASEIDLRALPKSEGESASWHLITLPIK